MEDFGFTPPGIPTLIEHVRALNLFEYLKIYSIALDQVGTRYGTSVANIGDVNHDGKQDVAVGAPGQDGGAGVVYVYLGQEFSDLLRNTGKYTVVAIQSAQFNFDPLQIEFTV